jgi:hypothetical protein
MGPTISILLLLQNTSVAITAELWWSMTKICNKPLFLFVDWLQLKTEDIHRHSKILNNWIIGNNIFKSQLLYFVSVMVVLIEILLVHQLGQTVCHNIESAVTLIRRQVYVSKWLVSGSTICMCQLYTSSKKNGR